MEESIIQNLKDAGCSKNQIEEFLNYVGKHEKNGELKLLRQQRDALLKGLHEKQRMIECIDYLMYQIKKEEERLWEKLQDEKKYVDNDRCDGDGIDLHSL